jgi:hypothetical protein
VVSALSRRHSVAVRLQTNLYGGTQATIVIPKELIGSEEELEAPQAQAQPEAVGALTTGTSALPSAAELSPSMPLSGSGQGAAPMAPVLSDHEATASRLGETSAPAWEDQTASPQPQPQAQQRPDPTPPGNADQRPDLPRRHAQASLAPELLTTTPATPVDESEPDHNPGLMAAFKKGMRSGQEEGPGDEAGNTA